VSLFVRGIDPVTSSEKSEAHGAITLTAAGNYVALLYPGLTEVTTSPAWRFSTLIPRSWMLRFTKSDASSWTFSIGYCVVL